MACLCVYLNGVWLDTGLGGDDGSGCSVNGVYAVVDGSHLGFGSVKESLDCISGL